jgi:hypothetical protein
LQAVNPATTPANPTEAAYWMGTPPTPAPGGVLSPVLIDTVHNSATTSDLSTAGPFFFPTDGNLYVLLQPASNSGIHQCQLYKSTDSGATWAAVDSANSPTSFYTPAWIYDGAHTVTVAYTKVVGNPSGIFLKDFNLLTGLWGAEYGAVGQPQAHATTILYVRPDNTRVVFETVTGPPGAGSGMTVSIYDPSVVGWTVKNVEVGTNIIALPGWDATKTWVTFVTQTYMDTDGTIGLILQIDGINNGPPIWSNRVFYQQYKPDNTLGSFFDFPGQSTSPQDMVVNLQGPLTGPPLLIHSSDKIFLPINRTIPTLNSHAYVTAYIGTPISAPVWTELTTTAGIDASVQGAAPPGTIDGQFFPESAISAATDGTQIIVVWTTPDATAAVSLARVRLAVTTNLADPTLGWSDSFVWDMTTQGPPGFYPLAGAQQQNLVIPIIGFGAANPAPSTVVSNTVVGGVPISIPRQGCRPRNEFDQCLQSLERFWHKIKFPPMCTLPRGCDKNLLPWDEDFGAVPEQSVPFRTVAGILTPAPAAGDQVVASLRINPGYDGLLTGFFWGYTGTGFTQGSGDIIWRIKLNLRYSKDLSNVPFALGSPQLPIPLTEGQILVAGQTVQVIVNVPNLSGMIQVGASRIVGGLIGFAWPR